MGLRDFVYACINHSFRRYFELLVICILCYKSIENQLCVVCKKNVLRKRCTTVELWLLRINPKIKM